MELLHIGNPIGNQEIADQAKLGHREAMFCRAGAQHSWDDKRSASPLVISLANRTSVILLPELLELGN
jgi:hypothetical protein